MFDPIEGILAILDEGASTGTNKYGLLLALIDLSPTVGADGVLRSEEIAAKLIEIHWDHARPFRSPEPLRQVTSGNRDNTTLVLAVSDLHRHIDRDVPFELARSLIPGDAWSESVGRVEQSTWRNPIRLLQKLPGEPPPFLYEILAGTPHSIRLFDRALEGLQRFGPVLRPMIEFRFVRFVVAANRTTLGSSLEDDLHEHLFGASRRMPPAPMRQELWELQQGRCVFTEEPIDDPLLEGSDSAIDHVIPWARNRISAVENFVVISRSTNSSKRDFLLSPPMLERWTDHLLAKASDLAEVAERHGWPSDLERVATVAGSLYRTSRSAPPGWNNVSVELLDDKSLSAAVEMIERLVGR